MEPIMGLLVKLSREATVTRNKAIAVKMERREEFKNVKEAK